MQYRDAARLRALLLSADPVAVIGGSWLSVPLPSAIVDARRWKTGLVDALVERAGWAGHPVVLRIAQRLSTLGTPEDIKLERVLDLLDGALPGLAEDVVRGVAVGVPNALHRWLASALASRNVSHLVTLNFDELVETVDPGLSAWSTTSPPGPAQILHAHGQVSEPASLRHVLARFLPRLPPAEHDLVRDVLADEVVCLGWAATDPDILAALEEGSGGVHVLIAGETPDRDTGINLLALSRKRAVFLYRGGFAALALPGAEHLDIPTDFATVGEFLVDQVHRLGRPDARRVLVQLSYEYSLSTDHVDEHLELLCTWGASRPHAGHETTVYLLSLAERSQARGRPLVAAALMLRAFARTHDPALLSDMGDAVERSLRGMAPGRALPAAVLHWGSVQLYRRRRAAPPRWVEARLARCLVRLGLTRPATTILDRLLAEPTEPSDLWSRAHMHRLRAIATASSRSGWREDIATAKSLFVFAARVLETGSTCRAEALCEMLAGGARWRERAHRALHDADENYRAATDASAPTLLRVQRLAVMHLPRRLGAWALLHL